MANCTAITKKGRPCRNSAVRGLRVCSAHDQRTYRKNQPFARHSLLPGATRSGYLSILTLSAEKRQALVDDLLHGDVQLDLTAETQVARYISASLLVYLQAYEDAPLSKRERALRLLLRSLEATARITSIHADLQSRQSPVQVALHDALRQVEKRLTLE